MSDFPLMAIRLIILGIVFIINILKRVLNINQELFFTICYPFNKLQYINLFLSSYV
jgi:hypothetical protein